jgi:hypothetical protein
MKKLLKIGLVLIAAGLITAALVWKFYVNKPHDDIEKATPDYALSAQELWKQYTGNFRTADSIYTGKVIELSGTVNRTEKSDSLVYAVFVMEVDSLFGDKSVRCEMLGKYNSEALAIAAGTPVKIKGFCTGFDQTDVKFNKCSITK